MTSWVFLRVFIALHPQISLSFINNTAQVGSALYLRYIEQCSYFGLEESSHSLQEAFRSDSFDYRWVYSYMYNYTVQVVHSLTLLCHSRKAGLWRASLLWRAIDSVSAKVLWCQCFIKSTSNVSYVDDRELGNWSKVMPMATMWQCFRVITCKACMHIMTELARYACMYMYLSMHVSL